MAFESPSDETGPVNVVVVPNAYERDRRVITGEALVLLEGTAERRTGAKAVRARRVATVEYRAVHLGGTHDTPAVCWHAWVSAGYDGTVDRLRRHHDGG